MINTRKIYCCECGVEVDARLTSGKEIYPHRHDLHKLPFWKCDCGNYVGCHHKTSKPTKPLGVIPNAVIRNLRNQIHNKLDPLWQQGAIGRNKAYKILGEHLGREYHTGDLRSVEECEKILCKVQELTQWAIKNRGFKV